MRRTAFWFFFIVLCGSSVALLRYSLRTLPGLREKIVRVEAEACPYRQAAEVDALPVVALPVKQSARDEPHFALSRTYEIHQLGPLLLELEVRHADRIPGSGTATLRDSLDYGARPILLFDGFTLTYVPRTELRWDAPRGLYVVDFDLGIAGGTTKHHPAAWEVASTAWNPSEDWRCEKGGGCRVALCLRRSVICDGASYCGQRLLRAPHWLLAAMLLAAWAGLVLLRPRASRRTPAADYRGG